MLARSSGVAFLVAWRRKQPPAVAASEEARAAAQLGFWLARISPSVLHPGRLRGTSRRLQGMGAAATLPRRRSRSQNPYDDGGARSNRVRRVPGHLARLHSSGDKGWLDAQGAPHGGCRGGRASAGCGCLSLVKCWASCARSWGELAAGYYVTTGCASWRVGSAPPLPASAFPEASAKVDESSGVAFGPDIRRGMPPQSALVMRSLRFHPGLLLMLRVLPASVPPRGQDPLQQRSGRGPCPGRGCARAEGGGECRLGCSLGPCAGR